MERYHPFIEVSVDGRPVSNAFYNRLNQATVTDAVGDSDDTIALTFDDVGNEIVVPAEGAMIEVRFGFRQGGLWRMGSFVIEQCELVGGENGELVKLTGGAVDQRSDIKEPVSEHFDDASLGEVVRELAARHELKAKVSDTFDQTRLPYLARSGQSTKDFLSRLAERHGAFFSIKGGTLLFVERGLQAPMMIERGACSSWSFSINPAPRHSQAEAGWFDRETGETRFETHSTGLEGPTRRLRHLLPTQAEALAAARGEGERLGRRTGSGSLKLAGMPEVMADMPLNLTGFRPEVNGEWRAGTVTHEFGDAYTTSIELVAPEKGKSR